MKYFRIVHRLPWRIRLIAPSLVKQAERCYLIEILLRKHAAIRDVRAVQEIGSVTIQYDATQLPEARLVALIDAVIGNLARTARKSAVPPAPTFIPEGPAQECLAAVEGMTCASCAALIELSLKRDPRVESVAVNYAAETVTLKGHLTKDELFSSVAKLGYTARPMDTLAQRRLLVGHGGPLDAVAVGAEPGGHARPQQGRQHREQGLHLAPGSSLHQAGEVGHLPGLDQGQDEPPVGRVEAQLARGLGDGLARHIGGDFPDVGRGEVSRVHFPGSQRREARCAA